MALADPRYVLSPEYRMKELPVILSNRLAYASYG